MAHRQVPLRLLTELRRRVAKMQEVVESLAREEGDLNPGEGLTLAFVASISVTSTVTEGRLLDLSKFPKVKHQPGRLSIVDVPLRQVTRYLLYDIFQERGDGKGDLERKIYAVKAPRINLRMIARYVDMGMLRERPGVGVRTLGEIYYVFAYYGIRTKKKWVFTPQECRELRRRFPGVDFPQE